MKKNYWSQFQGLAVTSTPIRHNKKNRDGSVYQFGNDFGGLVRVFPPREYRGKSERRQLIKARQVNRELEAAA